MKKSEIRARIAAENRAVRALRDRIDWNLYLFRSYTGVDPLDPFQGLLVRFPASKRYIRLTREYRARQTRIRALQVQL